MDIWREPDFRRERDTSCREHRSCRTASTASLKMRKHRTLSCDFFSQFGEELGNYVVPGEPLPGIPLRRTYPRITPLCIDEEVPGRAMPFKSTDDKRIQNPIASETFFDYDGRTWGIGFAGSRGEVFQDLLSVITDGRQFDSLLFESCFGALQLNQLPFAVRVTNPRNGKRGVRCRVNPSGFREFVPGRTGRERKTRALSAQGRDQSK